MNTSEAVVEPESKDIAEPSSSSKEGVAKPSPSEFPKDPLFDVFIDYDLDPNVMPNGKPTPKGYVWDGMRLVRRKANSKRAPGYPSDLWTRLSPETRAVEWEK